ncbi:MAG: hypothetical protein IJ001_10500 [Oscillospiraceae bacterium]|nr:hypothetical protein [Oscillospiraceae bacterium]
MPAILSGNALKIIAAITMFIDHMGMLLFPENMAFRIVGRLAFPIYAYMIAEGCKFTRNRLRYFLSLFLLGAVCQIVYLIVDGSTYFSILFTFSLSILMIYALDHAKTVKTPLSFLVFTAAVTGVWMLNRLFTIDYGFWGCMVPVWVSLLHRTKCDKLPGTVAMLGIGLLLLAMDSSRVQFYSLLALPLLMLYSGQRGKWRMKSFFYIFYPAHLVLLQAIAWLWA